MVSAVYKKIKVEIKQKLRKKKQQQRWNWIWLTKLPVIFKAVVFNLKEKSLI